MSCSWNVSSTRPWLVSECSASSATADANAARSRMISSTVSRPTIERSEPASTSRVNSSISVLLVQEPLGGGADRVLGAADLDDRDALQVGADALLAHRAADPTWMRRLDRSSDCSFCTTGMTKTDAPITTFWPDRSV